MFVVAPDAPSVDPDDSLPWSELLVFLRLPLFPFGGELPPFDVEVSWSTVAVVSGADVVVPSVLLTDVVVANWVVVVDVAVLGALVLDVAVVEGGNVVVVVAVVVAVVVVGGGVVDVVVGVVVCVVLVVSAVVEVVGTVEEVLHVPQ